MPAEHAAMPSPMTVQCDANKHKKRTGGTTADAITNQKNRFRRRSNPGYFAKSSFEDALRKNTNFRGLRERSPASGNWRNNSGLVAIALIRLWFRKAVVNQRQPITTMNTTGISELTAILSVSPSLGPSRIRRVLQRASHPHSRQIAGLPSRIVPR